MADRYEIRKVPKVLLQSLKHGEPVKQLPIQQHWYVIEDIRTGDRIAEYDLEQEAVDRCALLNRQP